MKYLSALILVIMMVIAAHAVYAYQVTDGEPYAPNTVCLLEINHVGFVPIEDQDTPRDMLWNYNLKLGSDLWTWVDGEWQDFFILGGDLGYTEDGGFISHMHNMPELYYVISTDIPKAAPLPSAIVLLGSGLIGLAGFRRKV